MSVECCECKRAGAAGFGGTVATREDICDACRADLNAARDAVAAGGIYWNCGECKSRGFFRHSHPVARWYRGRMNVRAPFPVLLAFDTCAQHKRAAALE